MKTNATIDYYIKSCWHGINRMYNLHATEYDITMTHAYVLLNIDKNGTPATKIAPALGLEIRSLTRTLKTLEEKKWIRKEIDTNDRRIVKIFLTKEGIENRNLAKKKVILFNEMIINKISPEKIAVFLEVINEIDAIVAKNSDKSKF
ncbi:MAG: MarR family transcriptional regulator [Pseudarcicella sp.]|nr:MarR family transcriptional regulator [Pseudarcicella sp.]MBP6409833.1 MarR family transcriptional regulator [Pseudarcicella sp.]